MINDYRHLLETSPDPEITALRLQRLCEDDSIRLSIESLSAPLLKDLITIIGSSNFLFHFICRHPETIRLLGEKFSIVEDEMDEIRDFDSLRLFKYRALFKLTWMDVSYEYEYAEVLNGLSRLAEAIIQHSLRLALAPNDYVKVCQLMTVFALGKLGASELNYSSDVDLVFVSANIEETDMDIHEVQTLLINSIRAISHAIEERTEEGFLYRVDLKLRPWGSSGPLCMALDATEHYYEASAEPWERFAWLRSRVIAGSEAIGKELRLRLKPYIFMRSLGTDDLDRFVQIKRDMSRARKRRGHWNIKVGEGGIRDIEFFAQMLQMVNAAEHEELQKTNTIEVLAGLTSSGMLTAEEEKELVNSYLFLRRLENRLQMIDEKQTHDLPDSQKERLKLARSLRIDGDSNEEILDNFENELFVNQSIAKKYFERVLPKQST
ncbi:MAG: glutamate-ammonia-ligase adenylyltransferase [Planctomycetota bacterium]|jgi:glutamate-ammonia-ligase adenylyltransferase